MNTDRRDWLKQTAVLLAGITTQPKLFGNANDMRPDINTTILLNSNENAYGPSPFARKSILDHYLETNRYPDSVVELLKKKVAEKWNVHDKNICLGAGSSEIIGLALASIQDKKKNFIVADPAYSVWYSQAAAMGYESIKVPLNSERIYDLDQMKLISTKSPASFIYICNPNNPTGTFVDPKAIREFAESVDERHLIFIDEAYTEYAELISLADFAITRPNVIVAKTFSKVYGLAGARVGYGIASEEMIKKLSALQPWPDANISAISGYAAIAALDDQHFVNDCKQKNKEAKQLCYDIFKKLMMDFIPSSTNFILFNIDTIKGNLTELMQARNILVQHRAHFGGQWCRVTIGTMEEMQLFTKALYEIAG